MKNYYLIPFVALMLLLLPSLSFAETRKQTHSIDIRSFDIGGVKIGMSFDEARAAMAKNFHIQANQIRSFTSWSNRTALLGKGLPNILAYESDGARMQVTLTSRLPLDESRPLTVERVTYEIPWTNHNEIEIKKTARTKYGPPSSDEDAPRWCEQTYPNIETWCLPDKAYLSINRTKIEMRDPSLSIAVRNFLNEQKTMKPNF
jgi:hypothetical protein